MAAVQKGRGVHLDTTVHWKQKEEKASQEKEAGANACSTLKKLILFFITGRVLLLSSPVFENLM